MVAYFCKRIRQSGRSKNFLADCHFLMEEREDMAEIKFTSKEHESFYKTMLQKSGNSDSYHRAFFYCIGISDTMRRNVGRIFDFEQDRIKPEGLHEGWQTGGTVRITRLAFNLWNGYMEQGEEHMSTPYEMFDCSYAPYFYEAIKLRYLEYCRELTTGRTKADGAEKGGR